MVLYNVIIKNVVDGEKRKSSRELLQDIYEKLDNGATEFIVEGCGQHNIGGPLWSKDGKELT
ncbi:MAG: hypothetical protein ACK4MM_04235, partial [Fervidobacterium sp.]